MLLVSGGVSDGKCRLIEAKKECRIGKNKKGDITKFKVRCKKYLYTLKIVDGEKAEKIRQSLPPCKRYFPPMLGFQMA